MFAARICAAQANKTLEIMTGRVLNREPQVDNVNATMDIASNSSVINNPADSSANPRTAMSAPIRSGAVLNATVAKLNAPHSARISRHRWPVAAIVERNSGTGCQTTINH